jgi:metal-responsive CopG/Arc/MetJ family transcriptional regulator
MKPVAELKDRIVWVRINNDLLKTFDNLAYRKSISRSEYIRQLMQDAVNRTEE